MDGFFAAICFAFGIVVFYFAIRELWEFIKTLFLIWAIRDYEKKKH